MRRAKHPSWAPSGQGYNPSMPGFSQDEVAFLKAYINPLHDNNYSRCPGIPNSVGARSYLLHQKLIVDDVKPDANGQICLVATGCPEAPLIQIDTVTYKTRSFTWPSILYPAIAALAPEPFCAYSADWMKVNAIGAYRQCCGGVKVEDITAPMYRTGAISVARNPAAYDIQDITIPPNAAPFGTGGNTASPTAFIRVYDSFSRNTADNEVLSNTIYSGPAEEGCYAIQTFLEPTANYIQRVDHSQKAMVAACCTPTNINTISYYPVCHAYKVAGDNAVRLFGYVGTSAWRDGSTNLSSNGMGVSAPSMTALNIVGNGLDKAYTVWRVTMAASFEFIPAAGSMLTPLCKPCMPTNLKCLQALSDTVATMPDGYPASANFFNELWDKFKSVYKAISPAIAPVITDLVPPQYKPLITTIKKVADEVAEVRKDIQDIIPQAPPPPPPPRNSTQPAPPAVITRPSGRRR